jgi:hypothetical protein
VIVLHAVTARQDSRLLGTLLVALKATPAGQMNAGCRTETNKGSKIVSRETFTAGAFEPETEIVTLHFYVC